MGYLATPPRYVYSEHAVQQLSFLIDHSDHDCSEVANIFAKCSDSLRSPVDGSRGLFSMALFTSRISGTLPVFKNSTNPHSVFIIETPKLSGAQNESAMVYLELC